MNLNVGILGATGAVGQKFIRLLHQHPWFSIVKLGASSKSAGKSYEEAAQWLEDMALPKPIADMTVAECTPEEFPEVDFVFSGLDSSVAGRIERAFAETGIPVVSNAKNFRTDPTVPLLIPEINPDHIELIKQQTFHPKGKGWIVTNPNCVVVPLASSLKPLVDTYGVTSVQVTSMQAISGAGYPGVPSLDILANVDPYIGGEEDKIEAEPCKILGRSDTNRIQHAELNIGATAVRVPIVDGHLLSIAVSLDNLPGDLSELTSLYRDWSSPIAELNLPSAPQPFYEVHDHPHHPQPRLHAWRKGGMQIHLGRLRLQPKNPHSLQFIAMAHNTVRGAAGGAILNAELLATKGHFG